MGSGGEPAFSRRAGPIVRVTTAVQTSLPQRRTTATTNSRRRTANRGGVCLPPALCQPRHFCLSRAGSVSAAPPPPALSHPRTEGAGHSRNNARRTVGRPSERGRAGRVISGLEHTHSTLEHGAEQHEAARGAAGSDSQRTVSGSSYTVRLPPLERAGAAGTRQTRIQADIHRQTDRQTDVLDQPSASAELVTGVSAARRSADTGEPRTVRDLLRERDYGQLRGVIRSVLKARRQWYSDPAAGKSSTQHTTEAKRQSCARGSRSAWRRL